MAKQKEGLVEQLWAKWSKLTNADGRVARIKNGMANQKKGNDLVHTELSKIKEAYTSYE